MLTMSGVVTGGLSGYWRVRTGAFYFGMHGLQEGISLVVKNGVGWSGSVVNVLQVVHASPAASQFCV